MADFEISRFGNRVLIVGGGVGGMKAAMDLAEAGKDALLIDKAPAIGGLVTQLDRTFPTNNCDMCTLASHLAEGGRQRHMEVLGLTQLTELAGETGGFTATLKTAPRHIDLEKCTACGDCFEQFPECVQFTPGFDHRAPTCMRYPQATPFAFSIDMDKCENVQALVDVCKAGAILPDEQHVFRELGVGAVILAPGADLCDPKSLEMYQHGELPNVVTGLEYERIMSASGSTKGELVRPSDNKIPRKIAWIQCVGSRNTNQGDVSYCSSVCCMYALKEAMVTKERFHDEIETMMFYMDMRTFGKDYELYYQRAKEEYGIRFVRSRPHSVEPVPGTDDLLIRYVLEGDSTPQSEVFDMVVLSTGFRIPPELAALGEKLGIELNEHNFAKTGSFEPVATSRPGVYVCGVFESPKDIPETLIQASAAACMASKGLVGQELLFEAEEEYPPERDVSGEEPRIGVFVFDCGHDIGDIIDLDGLVAYTRDLPQVVLSEMTGYGCTREALDHIQDTIREKALNRVVIGGFSPRTHEGLFQDTLRKAGLNKYLVEMANIRDQAAWVHSDQPEKATAKAKDLLRMAVASVELMHPLTDYSLSVNKNVLVVGGGVTGMNSALSLADQGYGVFLVERESELGGLAKDIRKTLEGEDVRAYIKDLIERVKGNERIQTLTGAIVVDHTGKPGLFKTGLQIGPQMYYREIQHGVTILATGALAHRPKQYFLDEHEAVVTQRDLDVLLEEEPDKVKSWKNVVMIQCVGSRVPENPNCSRICCQAAVKNALRIKQANPDAQVLILYRDMRTYGLIEDQYREARRQGVIFARYHLENPPEVRANGSQLTVVFTDPILDRVMQMDADCLALSTGFIADDESTEDLAAIFRLPRTGDGYFLEDHVKLRPVDLPAPGFFVAGTAHSPKSVRDSIAQALAAAGRAQTLLAKETVDLGAAIARVDDKKCAACLICVRACPFDVPFINADGYSEIDPAKCHGCGVCASECPAKAIQLMQFEDDQITAKVDGLLEGMM